MKHLLSLSAILLSGILLFSSGFAEDTAVFNASQEPSAETEEVLDEEATEEDLLLEMTEEELLLLEMGEEEMPFTEEDHDGWRPVDEADNPDVADLSDEEEAPNPGQSEETAGEAPVTQKTTTLAPKADPGRSVFSRELSSEEASRSRVILGANLTKAQRRAMYEDFGIEAGSVTELTVTNEEERSYLSGIVSEKQIGQVSLSSAYIQKLPEGSGLSIHLHNINYITSEIYRNALLTAGVKDAYVVISAPYPVSGTGALVGICKAYEDITGSVICEQLKQLSAEELVVTGELSEAIGSTEAAELIAGLKLVLNETKELSDSEVRSRIRSLAETYGIKLSKKQITRVLKLCRKLELMTDDEMEQELAELYASAGNTSRFSGIVSDVLDDVDGLLDNIGGLLGDIFD